MGTELIEDRSRAAHARARAYALLARLVSSPSRWLEAARADARMGRAVATYREVDDLEADHHHVFSFSCQPYESALLDPQARLGNETSARCERSLKDCGLAEGPDGEPPDHLATQLFALGLLSGAEADALEDHEDELALAMRARSRALLDGHLLRWLPMLTIAVRRTNRAWPIALLETVLDVALQHRSELGAPHPSDLDLSLPPLALSLDDEATGLTEIAEALARPARAGALLTRDDVARLGRATETPRGFGDRATLIENLLRSAGALGSIEPVIDQLVLLLHEVRAELGDERHADVPRALLLPWQERIDETCAVLERLREAALLR